MPLIMTPTEASQMIGAKCGGSTPEFDDPTLTAILTGLVDRLAAAMNVDSLLRGTHIDRFYLNEKPLATTRGPNRASVRLSNGYIVPDTLILRDEDGLVLTPPVADDVDTVHGIVDIRDWSRGYYSLEYESGFEEALDAEDEPTGVFAGTPEWMKTVTVTFLVQWYRTVYMSPKVPKSVSYEQVMAALYRQLYTLIYPQYQRPRLNVVWGERRL